MSRRRTLRALLLAGTIAALPLAAYAQATSITPDVDPARALGTTAIQSGATVTIDGGTVAGANLFHSFSQFSLAAGDTARWVRTGGDPAAISNVINRVTGGQASQINGVIDSTALPNASFFFINPAGVVFGAGAQVNVPAAAYFSTASDVRFAGGAKFAVATPTGSTLSMGAPESFGFVGGQGAISVGAVTQTFAPASASLSLIGSDVRIDGAKVALQGLDLVGVGVGSSVVSLADPLGAASSGAVAISNSQLVVSPSGGAASGPLRIGGGAVTFDGSMLVSYTNSAAGGGDILVAADQLRMLNASQVGASTQSTGAGGPGGDVTINARDIDAEGGSIYVLTSGSGATGRLSVSADNAITLNTVTLSSNTTGNGAGGDISLTSSSLLADTTYISAASFGAGKGGSVTISAPALEMIESTATTTAAGTGSPGNVVLRGDHMELSGGAFGSAPGFEGDSGSLTVTAASSFTATGVIISAATENDGAAGTISITSPEISMTDGGIDTDASGGGGVGTVTIQGKDITLQDLQVRAEAGGDLSSRTGLIQLKATGDVFISGGFISSTASGAANGGTVSIQGHTVTLDDAQVEADTDGEGAGGQVIIKGDTIQISDSNVTSNTVGFSEDLDSGAAGDVMLQGGSITIDEAAMVSSNTSGDGAAGKVIITGGAVDLEDGASVTSKADGGVGDAGLVSVQSANLTVNDSSISSDTTGDGHAGTVSINTGALLIASDGSDYSFISSDTEGDGDAGQVGIVAKSISQSGGGYISSTAYGDGNAGHVTINTGSLALHDGAYVASLTLGLGHAGDVSIVADSVQVLGDPDNPDNGTYISSASLADGHAGAVNIMAGSLLLDGTGFISSDGLTFGDAGDVTVNAGSLTIQGASGISSATGNGSLGNAGQVNITAGTLKITDGGGLSTETGGKGNAGTLTINANSFLMDRGIVTSSADVGASGASGSLVIQSGNLSLMNGAIISTVSNNTHNAGQVSITAPVISVDGKNTQIASENQAGNTALGNRAGRSGAAGTVHLASSAITVSNGGRISTDSFAGAAGDIEIAMPSGSVLTLQGADLPGSIETSSGIGTGGKITIASPLAVISNGGSILALGQQRGANVLIDSIYFINSSDRANTVSVDGDFKLVAGVYDVSAGTVNRDLSVLDASKVLRGQCPVARSTGQVSQLITRQVGPYAREPAFDLQSAPLAQPSAGGGGCN